MGRRKHADPGITLAVRMPTSRAMAVDFAARNQGITRSEFLRQWILKGLTEHEETLRRSS